MSKQRTAKLQEIDWSDVNCSTVRTAMFFDVFRKMDAEQQSLVIKILSIMKNSPKPRENK